jgi:hypothetical protein
MIGTENDVRQERDAIHEQTNVITPNLYAALISSINASAVKPLIQI